MGVGSEGPGSLPWGWRCLSLPGDPSRAHSIHLALAHV